jgi:hypothetical protein
MTITAVGTTKSANSSSGLKTLSFTPGAVGNCVVVAALVSYTSGTPVQTGISDTGNKISWQPMSAVLTNATTPPNKSAKAFFIGTVTGAGTATTITIAYSASITADAAEVCAQEFNSSVTGGAWSFDGTALGQRGTASSGVKTVPFPTLVPSGSGEIYVGYGQVQSTASTTSLTSGYTGTVTTTFGDIYIYNPNVSTSQSPSCTQTTAAESYHTAAVLIQYTIPPQTIALDEATVTTTAYVLAVLKQLLLAKATSLTTTAYVLAVLKQYLLSAATELTCTAYTLTFVKAGVTVVLSAATELVTTAYALTVQKTHALPIAAQAITSAYVIGIRKQYPMAKASANVTAYPLQNAKTYPLAKASVVTSAYALTVYKRKTLDGPSVETTAYPIQFSTPASILLDSPSCETTAYPLTFQKLTFPWVLNWWFKPRGKTTPWYSERKDSKGQEAG